MVRAREKIKRIENEVSDARTAELLLTNELGTVKARATNSFPILCQVILTQKSFQPKNYSNPKIFSTQKFFQPKNYSNPKIFSTQKFCQPKKLL